MEKKQPFLDEKKKENAQMVKSLLFSFSLIGEIGFATALPLVILGKLGEYLDNRYQTGHRYFFYTGVALAMIQTYFYLRLIVKKAAKEAERLSGLNPSKDQSPDSKSKTKQ